jgi:predicted Zn-dependent peptidase
MKDNFKKKVLKNGFTILFEKRNVPVVSISFSVRHGGVHESEEEKGISHFIEHMLYKGTKNRNVKQIAEDIERNGGELNGFTSEEITSYWCKMPSKNWKIGMDVLSDLVLNPLFDEKEVEKERNVIFEELKMYHDNPRMHVFDEAQKTLYNGTMGTSLIGTYETMNSLKREQLIEKFQEIYTPNNMVLTVVGDADFKEVVEFAEKNFSSEDKSEIKVKEFGLKKEVKQEEREGIDQANLVFAYHVPLAKNPQHRTAEILSAVLAEGMSSRLFSEIREKRNLAYSVKGDSNVNGNFAYNLIYVGTTKENVEKVKELILKEFEKVAKDLDEKELNQVKEQLIGHHQLAMEDSQSQMVNLLANEIAGTVEGFYDFEKNIKKVKLEDVKKMASEIKEGNYSFYSLVPK